MPRPKRLCQSCGRANALPKEKFCRPCRGAVLGRLEADGYFQKVPAGRPPKGRTPGRRGWE